MFDVGYDGKTATAYMDGQVVGSFAVPTALATVTPGDGFSISDADNQGVNDSVAEVAVYPTALTPGRIDAHWTAGMSASGACAAPPSDAYGHSVVDNGPAVYLRLGELVGDPSDRVAFDSSGHCTTAAATNGAYTVGDSAQPTGPLVSFSDGAVTGTSPGAFVTQSGAGLPSGNAARTVEFWWRSGQGNAVPDVVYGQSGSGNHLFEVSLGCGNQCGS